MLSALKVVIIGQGYVGLPVSLRAGEAGHHVVGLDLSESRTADLRAGRSYVEDISDGDVQAALRSGRFLATRDYDDAAGFDVAVITVPTPLRDSLPDLSFIESAGASLAEHITPGATVILESTTYPGTTDELLVPILEKGSGLTAGEDFHVGYAPERIDPRRRDWTFKTTPKVISGLTQACLAKVQEFYESIIDSPVPVKGTREAELTKLMENTFRHVNIALMDELAVFAHQLDVDIWDAIEAAGSKPFGFMRFTPRPGDGWSLPSRGPELPVLGGAEGPGADLPFRGAGERRQRAPAGSRGGAGHEAAQPGSQGAQRCQGGAPRPGLQT